MTASDFFLQTALHYYKLENPQSAFHSYDRSSKVTIIKNPYNLSNDEIFDLASAYFSKHGVAFFKIENYEKDPSKHVLLHLSDQLASTLPVTMPFHHSMEDKQQLLGNTLQDGTTKIFNKGVHYGQALSDGQMDWHQDGLGLGGQICTIALFLDIVPDEGGDLLTKNIIFSAINLALQDVEAFESLFDADAITIIRAKGHKRIKVQGPILYVNHIENPSCLLRLSAKESDEYNISFKKSKPLERAIKYFVNSDYDEYKLDSPGSGCFINNNQVLHSRTSFTEDNSKRLVSRKWYTSSPSVNCNLHFPGLRMSTRFQDSFKNSFFDDMQTGIWQYDSATGINMRIG